MLISMSMLRWYLQDPHLECSLQSDRPTMRSIRFMSENMHDMSDEFAYVGYGHHFFADPRYAAGAIIVCGNSYLYSFDHDRDSLLNRTLDAFDFFNGWEKRLLEASAAHNTLQEMATIAVEAIGNPILIISSDGDTLAHDEHGMHDAKDDIWNGIVETGHVHASVLQNVLYTPTGIVIDALSEQPQVVENVNPGSKPVIMQGIIIDDEQMGYVAVRLADESMAPMDIQLLNVLLGFLKSADEFTSAGAQTRPSADIVMDALEGRELHPNAVARFEANIIEPPYRLITFSHTTRNDTLVKAGCKRAIRSLGIPCMTIEHESALITLINTKGLPLFLDSLGAVLDIESWRIGVTTLLSGVTAFNAGLRQLDFCLERLGDGMGVILCDDLAFSYLIEMLKDNPLAASFTHPALGQLRRRDTSKTSDYYETLRAYVYNAKNLDKAADELCVHRNTLKYRMRVIREITGIDTDSVEEMQYLYLSFKLEDA